MSLQTKEALKANFANGKKPTQEKFWNLVDSFFHKSEGNLITSTFVDAANKKVTVNFSGGTAPLVFSIGGSSGSHDIVTVDDVIGLSEALNSLVPKSAGKGLSQNNYTDADVQKLGTLSANLETLTASLNNYVVKSPGMGLSQNSFTNAQVSQLQNLVASIETLTASLGNYVVKVTGMGLSQNNFTDAQVAQLQSLSTNLSTITASLNNYVVKSPGMGLSQNNFTDAQVAQLERLSASIGALITSLDNCVVKVQGMGLSQNNFTNAQVAQLGDLATYLNFLKSFDGYNHIKRVGIGQAVDRSLQTIESALNSLPTSFKIQAGELLIVDYSTIERSRDNTFQNNNHAVYALPQGEYGAGHDKVSDSYKIIDTGSIYTDARRVMLDKQYLSIGLGRLDNGEPTHLHGTFLQTHFNDRVYDYIYGSRSRGAMLRGRIFNRHQGKWEEKLNIPFAHGEKYEIATRIKFGSEFEEGFYNIIRLEADDPEDSKKRNRILLHVIKEGSTYRFGLQMEFNMGGSEEFYNKSFTSNVPVNTNKDGIYDVLVNLNIEDFKSDVFNIGLNVNGQAFDIKDFDFELKTVEAQDFEPTPVNKIFGVADYAIDFLKYSLNGEDFHFSLDQPGVVYSKTGAEMIIEGHGNNYYDYSADSVMPLYNTGGAYQRSVHVDEIQPDISTLKIDLKDGLNQNEWEGDIAGEIRNNGDVVFYMNLYYVGDPNKFGTIVLLEKMPRFLAHVLGDSVKTTTGLLNHTDTGFYSPIQIAWDGSIEKLFVQAVNKDEYAESVMIRATICFNPYVMQWDNS